MTRLSLHALRLAPLAAGLLFGPPLALADGGEPAPAAGPGAASAWGVGIALRSELSPYRGVEDETEVWPLVTFENRWVRVLGPGLELKLGQAGPVSFGLTASYAGDGYEASDSPFLEGMAKRKSSAWLGARVGLRTGIARFTLDWSGDAAGHSKGQKLKLAMERRYALGDLGLTPRLAATWHDRKFMQYYFGVTTAEARAGRPAYQAGAATDTEAGLRLDWRFTPQHTALVDLGVTALGAAAKNSPLVDRSSLPELRIGYLYRF